MHTIIIQEQMIPQDTRTGIPVLLHHLESHGFDLNKIFAVEYQKEKKQFLCTQELEPLEKIYINVSIDLTDM